MAVRESKRQKCNDSEHRGDGRGNVVQVAEETRRRKEWRILKKDGKRRLIDLRNVKMSPIGQVKRRYGGWTQNGWEIDREEICDK